MPLLRPPSNLPFLMIRYLITYSPQSPTYMKHPPTCTTIHFNYPPTCTTIHLNYPPTCTTIHLNHPPTCTTIHLNYPPTGTLFFHIESLLFPPPTYSLPSNHTNTTSCYLHRDHITHIPTSHILLTPLHCHVTTIKQPYPQST